MHVEIIATGSELMLGEQVDTNSPYIARKLRDIGLPLAYATHVGDDLPAMVDALRVALARSPIILVGGGLGPTVDDVTRPAVAQALGRALVFRPELLSQIEARFRAYGRRMSDNNRQQAYVPDGALPIENPVGTAPAFIVEHEGRSVICLPGVPREMMHLLDHAVIPYLRAKFDLRDVIRVRTLHTVGEGESRVDALIHDLEQSLNPSIGLSAKQGQVDVRVVARAGSADEAQALIAAMEGRIRERLSARGRDIIFGADEETLESVIASLLAEKRMTLATVELNTGGTLSSRLTHREAHAPSGVFRGGLVLSDPKALSKTLDVDVESAGHLGVVVRAAQRVRLIHDTSLGLAVMLGDTSPGETTQSEAGVPLVAALVWNGGSDTLDRRFGGHPGLVAPWTASLALGMLWRHLKSG